MFQQHPALDLTQQFLLRINFCNQIQIYYGQKLANKTVTVTVNKNHPVIMWWRYLVMDNRMFLFFYILFIVIVQSAWVAQTNNICINLMLSKLVLNKLTICGREVSAAQVHFGSIL